MPNLSMKSFLTKTNVAAMPPSVISARVHLVFAILLEFHRQRQPRKAALHTADIPGLVRPAEQARTLCDYR